MPFYILIDDTVARELSDCIQTLRAFWSMNSLNNNICAEAILGILAAAVKTWGKIA